MRMLGVSGLVSALMCSTALAQTAEFKCPRPGTVVEFSDGQRVTWQEAEANYCELLTKPATGEEFAAIWYAPTVAVRANKSRAFTDQIKPWTLWPLSVGKKITGRVDGVGPNPSLSNGTGSWIDTIMVDGYEKVVTKAGTFDAFVITRKEDALSHSYHSTFRQWYAPAPGVIVRSTFTDNVGFNRAVEATAIRQ
jgi:hypothetical protein